MRTMLIKAAIDGQEGCADLLIRKGANLNIKDTLVCLIKVTSIINLLLIVLLVALSIYL